MKRLLCLFLCSLLLIAASVHAGALVTAEGFQYKLVSRGGASITGYTGGETELFVPAALEGRPVVSIGREAFVRNDQLSSVILPEGVTSIADGAFSACGCLLRVSLPSTLKSIGVGAFAACFWLEDIDIPAGVTRIEEKTFTACVALKELSLPEGLKAIGGAAFAGSGLQHVDLPRSLTQIGPEAFASCPALLHVRVPDSVTKIGRLAFCGSIILESVVLPVGLTNLKALFMGCASLREVAIPKSVKSIEERETFDGCPLVSIQGFAGSAAEKYASGKNIPFTTVEPVTVVTLLYGGADLTGGTLSIDLASGVASLQFSALTSPVNPWTGVSWKSSSPGVASVDANGLVTGHKKGKTTVTATAVDGSKTKASCTVYMTGP